MDPMAMLRQLGMGGMGGGGDEAGDVPVPDTAETIYISSLALLKMLKHGACAAGFGRMREGWQGSCFARSPC